MSKFRSMAAVGVLLVGGMVGTFTAGGTAHAAASDCTGGRNGFIDISDLESNGAEHGKFTFPSGFGTITLKVTTFGGIGGDQRGYARLAGGPYQSQSRVWMDWTRDGGRTWLQCGPFGSGDRPTNSPLTSAAQKTNSSSLWKFRACGDVPGVYSARCTGWW
jgi:hypothetical protein